MKLRKGIFSGVIIALIMLLGITSNVNAAVAEQPMYLGIEEYRTSGLGYKAIEKIMWKITSYDDENRTNPDQTKTIYCIKAGAGFGSTDDSGNYVGMNETRKYTHKFDLKKLSTITGNYLNALPTGSNYNSLVWVLEHCYVPELPGSEEYRNELLTKAGISSSQITDDEIDIAQQLAIWYFTNYGTNDEYEQALVNRTFSFDVKEKADADYIYIGDKFTNNGEDRLDDAQELFNYLVDKGIENASTLPIAKNTINPITIDSSSSTIVLNGNNYILGPYTLSEQVDIQYTLTAALKNGSSNVAFKILNEHMVETDLEDLVGKQFFISVAENVYAAGLEFTVTAKTYEKGLTYWSVANAPTTEQPVVEIEQIEETYITKVVTPNIPDIPEEKVFDLALRKFITKINNVGVTINRAPVITNGSLNVLNNTGTATKPHTKTPLQVENLDTVLYTIRVYNEGEIDGYATQVIDYLPSGLKLKAGSTINTLNGWTNPSGDGRTIVTTKLSTTLLRAFNGTTLNYADLQIECVVDAKATTTDQSLKNVAEITAQTDSKGNVVTDRDSVPNNLNVEQKQNYNPGTSEQGWGYEDDDDYEELILQGKAFDLALRKFITKINNVGVTISREPVITRESLNVLKTTWTATKPHTKTPLRVENSDTVLYTIRVYNEGEIDGYATQVTDYLPNGLKLKAGSTINTLNGWTNPSGDGRTIVTTKLSTTLLKAFNGTTLDYADLEIECVVDAKATTTDQSLKNVAEITAKTDSEGNVVTDRDSVPNNLTAEQKQNYNPGTSEQGWGYEDDDDYEELILPGKTFDLALRKFITAVNDIPLTDESGKYIKEPVVDLTPLKNSTGTTAIYKHQKAPVGVAIGDTVIYTIRVYNEGELDGYVTEITDHLPAELEFVNDEFNAKYGWTASGRTVKTNITSPNTSYSASRDAIYEDRTIGADKVLLKAFDGTKLDFIEVQIKCRIKAVEELDTIITNIADITAFTDGEGKSINDRDSYADDVVLPSDSDLPDYKGKDSNKSILTDRNYHYEGQYDDDDFDKLILQEFDLALRKFITGVNDEKVTNRYPVFTTNKDENGNYIYTHTKEPVLVETTDLVEYTIRIYNEGNVAGYAKEIKDNIPDGLEFMPNEDINKEYRWIMLDKDGNKTQDVSKAKYITTDYLSKEQEKTSGENLIDGFDKETMSTPDYKDVKAVFKVVAPNSYEGIITNIAEISNDSDETGNPVIDRDSTPDNDNEKEDDIDVEHIKLIYFDLALRKFITAVDDIAVTNRYPVFSIDEEGNYIYTHTKEPVEVENGNIVTYTLRIYNEGTMAGYAKVVKDDLPEGLEFLPENDINVEYRWVMLDKDGNETENVENAVSISTDYLSKAQENESGRDNLLQEFDRNTMKQPDYRDIKVTFKVTEPNTSDRILINKAQIADDEDEDGKEVIDKDSTPDKWIDGEDDQDIEKVKVKYFDLALRKWVTQAIVIENGKEKVTETGHKAEDDPEEVVKVEIEKSKINKVVVKFRYKIRITNEGEIAGYATEISDYIPEGLKFVGADNPDWREVDGKIVTNKLADTLLQPGESAEVEVLLTWINGKDNMGLKVNIAEISEDKNDSDTPDIDSTPNNKVEGEDDIDDAPVILATKTGELINIQYVLLATGALAILSTGIIFIKKFVL